MSWYTAVHRFWALDRAFDRVPGVVDEHDDRRVAAVQDRGQLLHRQLGSTVADEQQAAALRPGQADPEGRRQGVADRGPDRLREKVTVV
jgi:hypothetical protein